MLKSKIKNKYKKIRKNNISVKSKLKNFIKKIKSLIFNKNFNLVKNYYIKFQSFIDRQSRKNIIKKNKSSRIKSKLIKKINLLNE